MTFWNSPTNGGPMVLEKIVKGSRTIEMPFLALFWLGWSDQPGSALASTTLANSDWISPRPSRRPLVGLAQNLQATMTSAMNLDVEVSGSEQNL
jgi:hypothetical protein